MTDKATPRPWRAGIDGNARLYGPDNTGTASGMIASFVGSRRADLDLTVRAVNAHDGLVEALTAVRAYVMDAFTQTNDADCAADLEHIDAALRAAGVEP